MMTIIIIQRTMRMMQTIEREGDRRGERERHQRAVCKLTNHGEHRGKRTERRDERIQRAGRSVQFVCKEGIG